MPLFDDPYTLGFSLEKKAVRLDRFNAGAPLLDNHNGYGPVSEVVLGKVEEAWLSADGGRARVKIAEDRPDILARVKDGILCNFSMGAVVHQMRDVTEKGDKQRRLLAIDWEPMELSIVPIPADANAQALASAETFPCTILSAEVGATKEIRMSDKIDTTESVETARPDAPAPENVKLAEARKLVDDAIKAKRDRDAEIERLGREFEMDELWITRHQKLGTPIEQVIKIATKQAAERAPIIMGSGVSVGEERDSLAWRSGQMLESLASRMLGKEVPSAAAQFHRHGFADVAYECLSAKGLLGGRTFDRRHAGDRQELIALGLHTPSDFPGLLGNVLNKVLLPGYQAAPVSFRQIGAERTFNDFRAHRFARPGDFPEPKLVGIGGEYQSGTMGEAYEEVTAYKYGIILPIAMETLVNDDLGAFAVLAGSAGQRAASFENKLFYDTCISANSGTGPTMRDGVVVFHSTHANTVSNGALDVSKLGLARAALKKQTSIDGLKLNTAASILLVSPDSETLAEQIVGPIVPAQPSNVNPFTGKLQIVADANLTGTRYYVFASPSVLPQFIYGSVGAMGPKFETMQGFRIDGVEMKLSQTFGCGAIEYRAAVTGNGA
jgi:hypothetical protein